MATVSVSAEGGRGGLLRRPTATTGFWSWITTVDHKRIGIAGSSGPSFPRPGCPASAIRRGSAGSPTGVLPAQSDDEVPDLRIDRWPAGATSSLYLSTSS